MSFTYIIDSQKIGGERIIGTIPSKVAIYWLENHADDFEDYFLDEDKNYHSNGRWNHIPKDYRLGNYWYENDNIFFDDNCELHDEGEIQVSAFEENAETNMFGTPILEVVADIPHPDLKTKNTNWKENLSPEMTEKLWPKDGEPELHVVYGQRIFKGNWEFEKFTIDHKFDAAKLTVLTETWAEEKVIAGFMYEDKHIKSEGCTDGDHKWDRAWIDDYLLD